MTDLLDEIERRLRRIIREEVANAIRGTESEVESFENYIESDESEETPTLSIRKKSFPHLLTAPEVADLLKINVQRVYELVRTRKTNGFPVIVIGERQYRFSQEALLEWIRKDNA